MQYRSTYSHREEKVYLDTSVISYLQQDDAPEKMKDTLELWEHFENGEFNIYLSEITLREINACSDLKRIVLYNYLGKIIYTEIGITGEISRLAERIIELGILPPKSRNDSLHIAAAVVNECDYILSWNFKHFVNPRTTRGIRSITTLERYKGIEICSPSAFLGGLGGL